MHGECHHFTHDERAISATWVIPEIKLAVVKGYKILEIHEVYEYHVTQYNRETGQGGLFNDYINTFLKLKAETIGYPSWVRTPNDEYRYIELFRQSEGILKDKDFIKYNAAKRGLAKLCLNSMWQKSKENPDNINIRSSRTVQILSNAGIEVTNLLFAGDAVV